jgi:hypothetical protein
MSTHEVAQTTTLVGGQTGPVVATCPQGELALSGGWNIPTQNARVFAARVVNNGWAVSVLPVGHPATTTVTAYVECLRGAADVSVIQRTTTRTIAPTAASDGVDNASGYIGACQDKEGLVGGGFDLGTLGASVLELENSAPSEYLSVYSWWFSVWNYDTVAHDVTFDLECATTTAVGARTSYPSQISTGLYAGMTGSAMATCPPGWMVAGGGFAYNLRGERHGFLGNEYSLHATATGWQGSLIAFTSYGLVAIFPTTTVACMYLPG